MIERDRALDLMIGEGPSARSVRIDLAPFTLVGATTRLGLLTTPLRDRFGHTGFVMSRNGTSLVLQQALEGTGPIRVHATPRLMGGLAFFRSPGRALLARLSDEEIRAIYPASLRSTSSHSPITVDDFLDRIAAVRLNGFAEIVDEGFPDVGGIAVAVAPPGENAVALNICFVAALVGSKERRSIAEALIEAGRRLGQRFGDPLWSAVDIAQPATKRSSA